jgi:hypothetical protein
MDNRRFAKPHLRLHDVRRAVAAPEGDDLFGHISPLPIISNRERISDKKISFDTFDVFCLDKSHQDRPLAEKVMNY